MRIITKVDATTNVLKARAMKDKKKYEYLIRFIGAIASQGTRAEYKNDRMITKEGYRKKLSNRTAHKESRGDLIYVSDMSYNYDPRDEGLG